MAAIIDIDPELSGKVFTLLDIDKNDPDRNAKIMKGIDDIVLIHPKLTKYQLADYLEYEGPVGDKGKAFILDYSKKSDDDHVSVTSSDASSDSMEGTSLAAQQPRARRSIADVINRQRQQPTAVISGAMDHRQKVAAAKKNRPGRRPAERAMRGNVYKNGNAEFEHQFRLLRLRKEHEALAAQLFRARALEDLFAAQASLVLTKKRATDSETSSESSGHSDTEIDASMLSIRPEPASGFVLGEATDEEENAIDASNVAPEVDTPEVDEPQVELQSISQDLKCVTVEASPVNETPINTEEKESSTQETVGEEKPGVELQSIPEVLDGVTINSSQADATLITIDSEEPVAEDTVGAEKNEVDFYDEAPVHSNNTESEVLLADETSDEEKHSLQPVMNRPFNAAMLPRFLPQVQDLSDVSPPTDVKLNNAEPDVLPTKDALIMEKPFNAAMLPRFLAGPVQDISDSSPPIDVDSNNTEPDVLPTEEALVEEKPFNAAMLPRFLAGPVEDHTSPSTDVTSNNTAPEFPMEEVLVEEKPFNAALLPRFLAGPVQDLPDESHESPHIDITSEDIETEKLVTEEALDEETPLALAPTTNVFIAAMLPRFYTGPVETCEQSLKIEPSEDVPTTLEELSQQEQIVEHLEDSFAATEEDAINIEDVNEQLEETSGNPDEIFEQPTIVEEVIHEDTYTNDTDNSENDAVPQMELEEPDPKVLNINTEDMAHEVSNSDAGGEHMSHSPSVFSTDSTGKYRNKVSDTEIGTRSNSHGSKSSGASSDSTRSGLSYMNHTVIGSVSMRKFVRTLGLTNGGTVTKKAIVASYIKLSAAERKTIGMRSKKIKNVKAVASTPILQATITIGAITLLDFLSEVAFDAEDNATTMAVIEAFDKCAAEDEEVNSDKDLLEVAKLVHQIRRKSSESTRGRSRGRSE